MLDPMLCPIFRVFPSFPPYFPPFRYNVYVFDRGGVFQNRTFGGRGSAHGLFNNPHAITFDHR